MKVSKLHKTKYDDEEDQVEDDEDEDLDEDPILEYKQIPHFGGINRIRAMTYPESHIVASYSETGDVNIFDLSEHFKSFDTPGLIPKRDLSPSYHHRPVLPPLPSRSSSHRL